MDCLTKMSRASFKRINNNYYKDNKCSTTTTSFLSVRSRLRLFVCMCLVFRRLLVVPLGRDNAEAELTQDIIVITVTSLSIFDSWSIRIWSHEG